MFRPLTFTLLALSCAVYAPFLIAAEPAEQPKGDPAGVCTEGTARTAMPGGKQMWANARLFTDAPPLEVQKWLTDKPEMEGKFLVVEFWRTWCGACKRMTPLMNTLQKKYGNELAVIGITGEAEEAVNAFAGPKKEYFLALDQPQRPKDKDEAEKQQPARQQNADVASAEPDQAAGPESARPGQGRYEAAFGVWGWPHVIILEPQYRTIVWEGFPGLKGYELTEAKVAKMLAIGREMQKESEAKKKPAAH